MGLNSRMDRFIVYAASAVYIVGLRDTMAEFKISNQQSLLGLSLYVLACESFNEQCYLFRN